MNEWMDVHRGIWSANLRRGLSLSLLMRGCCCWVEGSAWLERFCIWFLLFGVVVYLVICFDCHMRMDGCLVQVPANLDGGCLGPYPNMVEMFLSYVESIHVHVYSIELYVYIHLSIASLHTRFILIFFFLLYLLPYSEVRSPS